MIQVINARLGSRLKLRPGTKVYKALASTVVERTWFSGDELQKYSFGSMFDHYDESRVFRQWLTQQLKYVIESVDSALAPGVYHKRMLAIITNFDQSKFGYWAFRKASPGIENEPCEKAFQAAIKKRLAPAAQPRYSREDREAAFRSLSPEERWWLRMNAITVTSRERVIGGWEKLHDGGKNQRDWEVSYPKEWEGDPPAQLSEGEQYWLGRMRESIAEAQELWGHIVPEGYEKEL